MSLHIFYLVFLQLKYFFVGPNVVINYIQLEFITYGNVFYALICSFWEILVKIYT